MNTSDANRLSELVDTLEETVFEVKRLMKRNLTLSEYNQFKYNTLAHLEPGIANSEWFTPNNVKSLRDIVDNVEVEEETEEEEV